MTSPTLRDVARQAHVSVASASRAINGHSNVADSTRRKVLLAAKRLNYVPHSGARSLTTRRSNTIGVVLPDLFGEFFSEIMRGIDSASHSRGLQLLLANMHGSSVETTAAIRTMRGRVDGLLVMWPSVDSELLYENLPRGLPTVVMNGPLASPGHASIAIDNFTGAKAMVEHLVERGFRRIAHISGPQGNSDAEERFRGFRAAARKLLGDHDPIVFQGDFNEESGRAAGQAIAADRRAIDAVFAGNDAMAVGCQIALQEAGLTVPDDIAVAGFDDIPIARYVSPALTTMRVHIAELGARALELLVERLDQAGERGPLAALTLTPELVVRPSTGRNAAR